MKKRRKDPNRYPKGLDAKKVAEIVAYYEAHRGEDLLVRGDHKVVKRRYASTQTAPRTAWVAVPVRLLPQVRKLLGARNTRVKAA